MILGWLVVAWTLALHFSLRNRLKQTESELEKATARIKALDVDFTASVQATTEVVRISMEMRRQRDKLPELEKIRQEQHAAAMARISQLAASIELDLQVARDSTAALLRAKSILEQVEPMVPPGEYQKWIEYIDNNNVR